jgi:hypothetical protein
MKIIFCLIAACLATPSSDEIEIPDDLYTGGNEWSPLIGDFGFNANGRFVTNNTTPFTNRDYSSVNNHVVGFIWDRLSSLGLSRISLSDNSVSYFF